MKKTLLPILLATVWISLNEFVRNEYVVKKYWTAYYAALGLQFPSAPVNGAVWGLWSLLMATVFYLLARKFSWVESLVTGWVAGYLMMWVVIGNLGVLPTDLLPVAVPWSLLEAFGAVYLVRMFSGEQADPSKG